MLLEIPLGISRRMPSARPRRLRREQQLTLQLGVPSPRPSPWIRIQSRRWRRARGRFDLIDCYRVRSAVGGLGRRGGVRGSTRGTTSRFDRTSRREPRGAGAGLTVGGADGEAAGGAHGRRSRGRCRLGRARVRDVATRAEERGVDGRDGGHGDTSDWRVVFSRVSEDDLVKGVDLRVGAMCPLRASKGPIGFYSRARALIG